jgi:hypothetical protein
VSIPAALKKWPALANILTKVEDEVPRFGASLNSLGAKLICDAQRHQALHDLTLAAGLNMNRLRSRENLEIELQAFLDSDAPMMPIIGDSGSGKTSIAALLANSKAIRHGVLLRGVHMRPDDASIECQIERSLTGGEFGTYGLGELIRSDLPRPKAIMLGSAAAGKKSRLVVILDAINERDELGLNAQRIANSWMPRSIDWLRRNNVKLILTCRSETWSMLMPLAFNDALFPPVRELPKGKDIIPHPPGISRPSRGGLWVGDLTENELESLSLSYGLRLSDHAVDARHPFFLRLAAELSNQDHGSSRKVSRIQLIEEALNMRAVEVSRAYPNDVVGVNEARSLISAIALTMLVDSTDYLSSAKVMTLPFANSNVLRGLLEFGVLERVGSNYRFRFDQYVDVERSRILTIPSESGLVLHGYQVGDVKLQSSIAMAAERMYDEKNSSLWHYRAILRDSAPIELRTNLLIEVARLGEDGYGVRVKDWADKDYRGGFFCARINEGHFGKALKELYREDASLVRQLLVRRLDDDRVIVGSDNHESTISSLCGGCLRMIAGADIQNSVLELLRSGSRIAKSLLEVILQDHPAEIGPCVLSSVEKLEEGGYRDSNESKVFSSNLLVMACELLSSSDLETRAITVLRRWTSEENSARVRGAAGAAIRKIDPDDSSAFDDQLLLLSPHSGNEAFDHGLAQIGEIPEGRRDEVVKLVLARLDILRGQWRSHEFGVTWTMFAFLGRPEISLQFVLETVETLKDHVSVSDDDNRAISDWALTTLRRLPEGHTARDRIISLLTQLGENAGTRTQISLVDAAYCDFPLLRDDADRIRQILGKGKLADQPLHWAVVHSGHNSMEHPADTCVETLAVLRVADPYRWDEAVIAHLRSEMRWSSDKLNQFGDAIIRYWSKMEKSSLTEISADILAKKTEGKSLQDIFSLPE